MPTLTAPLSPFSVVYCHTMKHYALLLLLATLTGCGQIGPLYLPDGPAPIHVPKPQPETKTEQPTKPAEPEKTK